MSKAIEDVVRERERQQLVEGWKPEHDDLQVDGELAAAGGCYALHAHDSGHTRKSFAPAWWPWQASWYKPTTPRRDLVKAAALIIAEIERLDRKEGSQ